MPVVVMIEFADPVNFLKFPIYDLDNGLTNSGRLEKVIIDIQLEDMSTYMLKPSDFTLGDSVSFLGKNTFVSKGSGTAPNPSQLLEFAPQKEGIKKITLTIEMWDKKDISDPTYIAVGDIMACLDIDTDGDMIADWCDPDSDNDGCPDIMESGLVGNAMTTLLMNYTEGDVTFDFASNPVGSNGLLNIIESDDTEFATTAAVNTDWRNDAIQTNCGCTTPDKDGDGICDMLDLDDDNDGIPDLMESCTLEQSGTWTLVSPSTATFQYSDGTIVTAVETGSTLAIGTVFNAGADWSSDLVGDISLRAIFSTPQTLTFSFTDSMGSPISVLNPILHLDALGGGGSTAIYTLQNGDTWTEIAGTADFGTTDTTAMDESGLPNSQGSLELNQIVSTIEIAVASTAADGINMILEIYPRVDTDGDGLTNDCDLDSDGDGCPDAVEAGHIALTNVSFPDSVLAGPFGDNGLDNRLTAAVDTNSQTPTLLYTLAMTGDSVDFKSVTISLACCEEVTISNDTTICSMEMLTVVDLTGMPMAGMFSVVSAVGSTIGAADGMYSAGTNTGSVAMIDTVFFTQTMFGCMDTMLITVNPMIDITGVVGVDPSDCMPTADGMITISTTGGIAPLMYSIDGGMTFSASPIFTSLADGIYQIVVKDAGGICESTFATTTAIISPPAPTIDSIAITDVKECGASDGAITVFGSGGSQPLEFSLDGGTFVMAGGGLPSSPDDSTFIFSGLASGPHTLVVRNMDDACMVTYSAPIVIGAPMEPVIDDVTVTNITDCSTSDGQLVVQVTPGKDGQGNPLGTEYSNDGGMTWQSGNTFNTLPSGMYAIQVRTSDTTCVVTGLDTLLIAPCPIDTMIVIIPKDSMQLLKVDTTMLPGSITSITFCPGFEPDPAIGTAGTIDMATTCIPYTAGPDAGVDTFCVVICDDLGNKDTTIRIIIIPPTPDTVRITTMINMMETLCSDVSEVGEVESITVCPPGPTLGTVNTFDKNTGCATYTAGSTPGVDNFKVVICGTNGLKDTTYFIPTILGDPGLEITKKDSVVLNADMLPQVGEQIIYTITATNTGSVDLMSVTANDPLLAKTLTFGNIPIGGSFTITEIYVLTQNDIDNGKVTNQAFGMATVPTGVDPLPIVSSDDPDTMTPDDETCTYLPGTPDMTITKTDSIIVGGDGIVTAGDSIAYDVTVTNTGVVTLTNVTINDPKTGDNITIPTLAVGASNTVTLYYVMTQNDIDNGKVTNQAFGGYTPPIGTPATNIPSDDPDTMMPDDETCTFLPGTPDMTLIKTDQFIDANSNGVADLGEMILYTITATNTGTVTLTDVVIQDVKIGANELISSFGPDSVYVFTMSYAITQNDIDNGQVLNQAIANNPMLPPIASCDPEKAVCQETCTNLPGTAELKLIKTDQYVDSNNDMVVSIGDTIFYTLTATNIGTVTMTEVKISDPVIGLMDVDAGTLAPMASYSFTVGYAITQNDIDNGKVINQAFGTGKPPGKPPVTPVPSDDPDKPNSDDPTCTTLPGNPAMEITKDDAYFDSNGDALVNVGDSIEYTITVTNTGTVTLDSIVISDPVIGANQLIDSLTVMNNFFFKVKYAITQNDIDNGKVLNRAVGTTPKLPPTESCDPDKATCQQTCTNLPGTPDMKIIKEDVFVDDGNGMDNVGDSIEYTITVTNTGTVTLDNVEITDPLLGTTEMIATLGVGEIYVFTERYGITQNDIDNGIVLNQAFGTGMPPPTSPPLPPKKSDDPKKMGTEDENCTLLQGTPDMTIIKDDVYMDSNGDGVANVGDTINYIFTVTNTGNITLDSVVVNDPVIGSSEDIGTLLVGQIYVFSEKYAITQNDIDNGQVINQAIGITPKLPPTPSCDPDKPDCKETCTILPGNPDMTVVKDDLYVDSNGDGEANIGDTIIYTFTITNTGTVTLDSVVIDDPVIGSTEIIDTLSVGEIYLYTEKYGITQNDIDNGKVINQALGKSNVPPGVPPLPPVPSDDPDKPLTDDPTCTTLPGNPDMTLIKEDVYVDANGDMMANAGDEIVYTITVENTGTVTLDSVIITDPLLGTTELIATLSVNEKYVFTETYVITQNDVDNGIVLNQAFGKSNVPPGVPPLPLVPSDDPKKPGTEDQNCTVLPGNPAMTIIKDDLYIDSNGDGVANVGDTIEYTFTVENTGTVTLDSVVINDPVIGSSMLIDTLSVGEVFIYKAKYAITQNDIDNGKVINQVLGKSNVPPGVPPLPPVPSDDPDKPLTDDPTCTTLPGNPDMTIIKDDLYIDSNGDGEVNVGDMIEYTFTITNTGTVTLDSVVIIDPVISSTEVIDTLSVSEVYIYKEQYTITQNDIDNGKVINQAFGKSNVPPGVPPLPPVPSDDPDKPMSDDPTCTTLPGNPDMTLVKEDQLVDDGDGKAGVGDTIIYTITVTNTGTVTLTNVEIIDPLLGTTEMIATLIVNQNYVFTEKYAVTQNDVDNGIVLNQAFGSSNVPPGVPPLPLVPSDDPKKPGTEDKNCTILPGNSAMTIIKDDLYVDNGDGIVNVGDSIVYTFTIENTGTVTLDSVIIDDPVIGSSMLLDTLMVGEVFVYKATYFITQNDIDNGKVINQAFGKSNVPPGVPPLPPVPSDDPDKPMSDDPTCTTLPGNPDMTIIKDDQYVDSNGDGEVNVGDSITYTFTVTNTGNVTLTDIAIDDPVIGSVEFITVLNVNQVYIYTEQYAITQNDIDNGKVINQAFGDSNVPPGVPPLPPVPSDDPEKPNTDDPTCTTLPGNPDMTLVKEDQLVDDGDGVAGEGDTIVYMITVTNTGTVTLTDVEIIDPLLGTTEMIATLSVNQNYVFTEKYAVTQNDVDNGVVLNQAFGTSMVPPGVPPLPPVPSDDPKKPGSEDQNCTVLLGNPAMTIIKDDLYVDNGDGIVNVGDSIVYTFTVENTGTVTLDSVVIDDAVIGSSMLIDTLMVGEVFVYKATYFITQNDIDNGKVINQAFGDSNVPPGVPPLPPVPSDDPDKPMSDDPTCTTLPGNPDMTLVKEDQLVDDGDGVAGVGDTIVYTITVTNTGTVTLTDVEINDPLLGTTEMIATLAVNQIYVFKEKYAITQNDVDNGIVLNQALGTSMVPPGVPPLPPVPSDDPKKPGTKDQNCTVLPGNPAMTIIKDDLYVDNGDGIVNEGDTIVYTFTVENTGTVTLDNVVVDDPVIGSSMLIDTLTVGEVFVYKAKYLITQNDIDNGKVINQAFGNSNVPPGVPPLPPVPSDDPDKPMSDDPTCTTLPGSPAMTIVKEDVYIDSNFDQVANAGDEIQYTITVTNTGTVTLDSVLVNDPLLGTTELIDPLVVNQIYVFTEFYTITQNDVNNGIVLNQAFGTGMPPPGLPPLPPVPSDDPKKPGTEDENCTILPGNPAMTIVKEDQLVDDGDNVGSIGDTIIYTITVTNTGTVTLDSVIVTDPLLGTTEFIDSLEVNEVYVYTEKYAVTQNDIDNGIVLNQAFGTSMVPPGVPPLPPVPSDDPKKPGSEDENCTVLKGNPAMTIVKEDLLVDDGDGVGSVGDSIIYTITVTNTGSVTLTDVEVNDPLLGTTEMIAILNVGQVYIFTEKYAITQTDVDNGIVLNQAFGTSMVPPGVPPLPPVLSDDPKKPGSEDENCTVLKGNPAMTVIKEDQLIDDGDGVGSVGDMIKYTITVTNTGTVTLSNVVVSDPLTGDVELIGDLAVNEVSVFTLLYAVTQNDVDNGEVLNQAFGNADVPPGVPPLPEIPSDDPKTPNEPGDPNETPLLGQGKISIEKEGVLIDNAPLNVADVNDQIEYTFRVTNTGTVTLTDVDVTDPLFGMGVIGTVPTLLVNEVFLFKQTYTLLQNDIDNGEVVNQAVATGKDPNGDPVTDDSDDPKNPTNDDNNGDNEPDDPTVLPLSGTPSVSIEKDGLLVDATAPFGVFNPGDQVSYAFTVRNTGTVTLTDVEVTDPLLGVGVIETIGTLAVNGTYLFTEVYTLTQVDIDRGEIENQALVTGTPPSGPPVTDDSDDPKNPTNDDPNKDGDPDDPTKKLIPGTGKISILKVGMYLDLAPMGANPGDEITYDFDVQNTGTVTLTDVEVTDPLIGVGTIEVIGTLAVNQIYSFSKTYVVTQGDIDLGRVDNQATATGNPPSGPPVEDKSDDPKNPTNDDPNKDGDPDDPTSTPLPGVGKISIVKVGDYVDTNMDGFVNAGDEIAYGFDVTNTGSVTLTDVEVNDPLFMTNPIEIIGTLQVGQIYSFVENYTITQDDVNTGAVLNQATATGNPPSGPPVEDKSDDPKNPTNDDPNRDNDPDDPTLVPLPGTSSIGLEKLGTYIDATNIGVSNIGDSIKYTLVVTNTGTTDLSNLVISDPKILNAVINVSTSFAGNILPPGKTATVMVTYALTQDDINVGRVENTATVIGDDPNGDPVTDDSDDPQNLTNVDPNLDGEPDDPTIVPLVGVGMISIEKSGEYMDDIAPLGTAQPGEKIRYQFLVKNTGTVSLTDVVVDDPLLGGQIGLIPNLEPGQTITLFGTYTLTQNDINFGKVINQATATGKDPNGTPVTDDSDDPKNPTNDDNNNDGEPDDPTVIPLPGKAEISIQKSSEFLDANDNNLAEVGEFIKYTFVVTNIGAVTLDSVVVVDPLFGAMIPAMNYLGALSAGGATMAPGEEGSFMALYALTQEDIDAGLVENQATAIGKDPNGDPVTDISDDPKDLTNDDPNLDGEPDDPTITPLPGRSTINIIKVGEFVDANQDGISQVGEVIRYTIETQNTGSVTLTGVEVNDPLLGGLIRVIGTLIPGQKDIFVASYALTQADLDAGKVVNTATATGNPPSGPPVSDQSDDPKNPTNDDPNKDDNPDDPTVVPLLGNPQIALRKVGKYIDSAPVGISAVGEVIQYTFEIENVGNINLTDVVVTDPLLGGLIGTLPSLAIGQTKYLTASYNLQQIDLDNGIVINNAIVSGSTPSGITVVDMSDDPMDPVNKDIDNDGDPDDPTITPLNAVIPNVKVIDPCGCEDPLNFSMGGMYFFHEFVVIRGEKDQKWSIDVGSTTGIYDENGSPLGSVLIEEGPDANYTIDIWVKRNEAYTFQATNTDSENVSTSGLCEEQCNACDPDAPKPSLGCIETINVTLGDDCTALLDPQRLSDNNGIPLIIVIKDADGNVIDTMGIEHVGQELIYEAIDTCSGALCWGHLNLELKRIPDLTTNSDTIMCGADYAKLGLVSIKDIEATLGNRCIVNVTDLREEIEKLGSRCDTIVTIRKITAGVNLDDIPRRVTLHIDTLYEVPLVMSMVECPYGETLEDAIYVDCDDFDGAPTPKQIAEMRGDTAAYPFVDKGLVTTSKITLRDSIVRDTVNTPILIDGFWVNLDVITKDTIQVSDTTYTSERVVLRVGPGETCNMSVIYTDEFFDGCTGPNTKIKRHWSILDWCTGEEKQCTQWIIINDKDGPEIKPLKDVTIDIDPWRCFAYLPLEAEVTENCGGYRLEWSSTGGTILGDSVITAIYLKDGPVTVTLKATDVCGNVSYDSFVITAVDNTPPIVQTYDQLHVTLTGTGQDGVASILVESIDAGSSDAACGEITRCILLDEELNNPVLDRETGEPLYDDEGNAIYHAIQCKVDGTIVYTDITKNDTVYTRIDYVICKDVVKLCCENIGDNKVVLVVDDESEISPTSYGWTIVTVEDKLIPTVTCPDPITINCDEVDFYIPRPTVSGSVCADEALRYTIAEDLNSCGTGQLLITWMLAGEEVCTSIIYVTLEEKFDPTTIKWPRHFNDDTEAGIRRECEVIGKDKDSVDVYGIVETFEQVNMGPSIECGGSVLVEPVWCDAACGQVLASYEDQVVESSDACKKIVRRWTVIDWCTWTPNSTNGDDDTDSFEAINDEWIADDSPCEDCHKLPSEDVYFRYKTVDLDGHYDFVQVIKILDEIDPEISVIDSLVVDIAGGADTKDDDTPCTDSDVVTAAATDFCGDIDLDPSTIRWDIEVFDADGNRVAGPKRVTGAMATMTTGEGGPGAIHTIVWKATDDCGNRGIAETTVLFEDNKNPIAVCIEDISTATMNTDGSALVWAKDYDLGSFDNCSEVEVYFKDSLGNKVPSMIFTCADIINGVSGTQDLQVFFSDQAGNETYCFARLRIDDNSDSCPNVDVDEAMIGGEVRTEMGDMVEHTEVSVIGTGRAATTEVDGAFVFPQLATEEIYELSAKRNDDPLNGVSTLDLVKIQQHILGIRLLDSPYKVIAADVNGDTRVSAVDLVQLRQLLLGRKLEFQSNDSWRFVDAKQDFARPLTPFPFTEVITIDPLQSDRPEEDFIGVKIGDVSGNAIANSLIAAGGRSEISLGLEISNTQLEKGLVRVPVSASNFIDMTGYQMTFDIDHGKVLEVESGAIQVSDSYAILDDHTLTMAWYSPVAISTDAVLFTLVLDMDQKIDPEDAIKVSSSVTVAKAYRANDDAMEVDVNWIGDDELSVFRLMQNTPNPWDEQTTIGFHLPKEGETTLRVLDLTGRVVWEMKDQFSAGYNQVSIQKSDIGTAGIWYYEVQSGAYYGSRKMIIIE